ncbi:gamma-glutamyltransferase [Nocardioides ochotonae]|uniref:gamma-glutamyltransferase n=1 Tax=Nocardioides ochotonae TaxID=2685869 RepID=UPI00140DCB62|nr:gamma-glutamyltransferase [Nocardioides ochotonae]
MRRTASALLALSLAAVAVPATAPGATAAPPGSGNGPNGAVPEPRKVATAVGAGGAVSTVDPYATQVGLRVLRRGGNAVDAAVAAAATLGVTEPYSAGIGGGGYFVHYDAKTGRVRTIDGRETAPSRMRSDSFIDPATGEPYRFTPELVTSGVSVGVPGTPATWEDALGRWGTWELADALRPATRIARQGFVVDQTFHDQTDDNAERFGAFTSTRKLFLRGGKAPRVGSVLRNRDLAETYDLLARRGAEAFYRGPLARDVVRTVRTPPKTRTTDLPVPPGRMRLADLREYRTAKQAATRSRYRDVVVHGMAPSSSGGTTIGEALNILERFDLEDLDDTEAMHHYLEASALAFADRGKYVGDPAFVDVPVSDLLSDRFAAERACELDPTRAATKPVAAGDVTSYDGRCDAPASAGEVAEDTENISTTNLTVADRWGNVVEYTLTIEQTGGSGIVVPGRGFLLNNELTDFSTVYDPQDPNRIQPGKRPRSSMSPTIITRDGKPVLALGSPGGSTIITTVLQMIVGVVDRGLSLPEAIAAPRAAQRNTAAVTAEPAFIDAFGPGLTALGHTLTPSGDAFTSAAEIGAATAIGFGPRGRLTAVAEPERRGGGSAAVVKPVR